MNADTQLQSVNQPGRTATTDSGAALFEEVTMKLDGEDMPLSASRVAIRSRINHHVKAIVTGMVQAGVYDSYVQRAKDMTEIQIKHKVKGQQSLIYEGIVTYIEAQAQGAAQENAVYMIRIEADSHTRLLDIEKIYRSFQKIDMQEEIMVRKCLEDFPGADFINNAAQGNTLNFWRLVYHDTYWEFLRRQVSKHCQGLIADATQARPLFQYGTPEGRYRGELTEYEFTISKKLGMFSTDQTNEYETDINEFDYMQYSILDRHAIETFAIGDNVTHLEKSLYIYEVESEIIDHKLYNTYKLATKNGLQRPNLLNGEIQGLSLPGKVIDVQNNRIKLHLNIDENQPVDEAYWFPYASYHATHYCMPEINDYVNLHIPTLDEVDAVGLNSIKQNPEGGYTRNNEVKTPANTSTSNDDGPIDFVKSASDPTHKLMATIDGRMVDLARDRICIQFDDDKYVILGQEGSGIVVNTNVDDITFYAENEIIISAKERVHMQAKEGIALQSKDSVLEITPSSIYVMSDEKKIF